MTNTYRVYVLDTTVAEAPKVHVTFIQAPIYKDAWQGARHALSGGAKAKPLFSDKECKVKSPLAPNAEYNVAKIDDIRPRNVKLDKAALQELLADPKATAEEKLAAMTKLLA